MLRTFLRPLGAFLLAGWAAGCTVGPDYKPDEMDLPSTWTEPQPSAPDKAAADAALKEWWASFKDPLLDRLVAQAIAGNEDLKIARQRLVQARASRAIAASVDYPQVTAGASRLQSNSSTTVDFPPGIGQYRTWELGFDASWEIDIFGGTRRSVEASEAEIGAAIEDRRTILVSLLAELAGDYASLRGTQLRLDIAQRNIESARKALELTKQEFQRGLGTELELAQARAQWNNVRSAPPQLRAAIARLSHAIGVLVGGFPGDLEAELTQPAPLMGVPSNLPVALPSETLVNRPDVRRAERHYAAATARIGVATAELFPHFSIPLMLDPTSSTIGGLALARSLNWSIGLAAKGLVYDAGKTDASIESARAAAEAARIGYEETVRGAFRDVEDALVNYQTETERNGTLKEAATDSDVALDRATKLYGAGLTDFLKVLDSERTAFAAEDQEAQSRIAMVQDVIALFKALGGGWQAVSFDDVVTAQ
ncbi:MAG TPA: efflux transporter outer membrane subunit [Aliidongia sp.]|nr:efflux transporter outer membrane subunit [Aliidongia sp.]